MRIAYGVPGRLNTLKTGRLVEPSLYAGGAGLYLQIGRAGTKSWILRYHCGRAAGKVPSHMSLGLRATRTIAAAREDAVEARKTSLAGTDPVDDRRCGEIEATLEASRIDSSENRAERSR